MFVAVVCLGMLCVGMAAQTAVDGAVGGRLVSGTGKPMAGIRIVVQAVDADAPAREVKAGRSGRFLALRLAAGEYVIEARDGARVLARERVLVELGSVAEVELRVGRVAGSVSDAFGGTITATALAELPLEARRWEDASRISSEVHDGSETAPVEGRSNAGTLLSFRGIAPTQNASLLDGVSGDQGFRGGGRGNAPGGPRAQSNFGQGAVHAFSVAAHSYSAQYGGGAGGLLTTASRSGSGVLHGGGFYLGRESAWAAANPFSVETHYRDGVIANSLAKPHDSQQSFGGRIGGAVWRRRVFGFASVEEQLRNFPAVASPSTATFYALTATQTALLG
ncbi:MAG TPA: carboxypeptidase-like regulatory domain-containing protein, partial [Acidobacteriaceae bacterium]|nr:carboxypeptidase-like regulatory domain-containing protein [Acidobacteriaceae bacterium]